MPTYGGEYANSGSTADYYAGAYATGGSFTVPGAGGTDSVNVNMDVTPGEVVDIRRPGEGGGREINIGGIHLHGITRPNDWLENDAAIQARTAQAVEQALRDR